MFINFVGYQSDSSAHADGEENWEYGAALSPDHLDAACYPESGSATSDEVQFYICENLWFRCYLKLKKS